MASATKTKSAPRKGSRWPLALTYAAVHLGCTPQHLSRVLNGQVPSYGVREGYDLLVKSHGTTATSARGPRPRKTATA